MGQQHKIRIKRQRRKMWITRKKQNAKVAASKK